MSYKYNGCSSLTSIDIPSAVTSIGGSAFLGCSSLASVIIPNSVTSIGASAFRGCSSLTSVTIPNSVTSIGEGTFYDCNSLTSITISNSVTSIGEETFRYCSSLTSVTIPNSVTSIGYYAFLGCSSLASVTIPNSVTQIEDFAFYQCISLTSVIIPNSVTSIGQRAFNGIDGLKYINVESTTPFKIESSTFPSNVIIFVPKGCKEAYQSADVWKNYIISDLQNPDEAIAFADAKVKEICVKNWDTNGDGELSYAEAAAVSSVQQVFRNNTDITSFDELQYFIGLASNNGYKYIYEYAFENCSNLKSIKLPDNLTGIGKFAFAGCKSLTSIVIPKTVENVARVILSSGWPIDDGVRDTLYCNPFLNCSSLSSIIVENGNENYDSRDNCNAIIETSSNTLVSGCKNTVIPNSVKIIGNHAFRGCEGLTSIVIPDLITKIQSYAFLGCNNLSSITFGSSIHYLETGSNTESYGDNHFDMFAGCTNLKKVIIKDLTSWSAISIYDLSDSPLNVAHHLYSDENTEITDLMIPNGVNSISRNAFAGCSFLKSVTIPNSVKSIGGGAFYGCSSLTSITIPNSVTQIGGAFHDCTRLSAIIWDAEFVMPSDIVSTNTTNMLFYTKDASYAPSKIKNVIVNGTAQEIVLSDASSGNNFYCPREFTAEKISYTHNYRMTSGLDGQARGWETIALPFTVGEITHESKGKLLPFGAWTSTSDAKPFWLCNLSSSGFTRATSIEANTPYIICMPNNNDYDSSFNLSGNVTFSATNVKVPVSSSVTTAKSNGKTFIPAFCAQEKASGVYALNVNNSYHTEAGGYTEGSAFVSDLRAVSPFEAYMTTDASNAKRAFFIEFNETTGIDEIPSADNKGGLHKVFNLNGQLVKKANTQSELDETLKQLPTGVYIINGKKTVIKR